MNLAVVSFLVWNLGIISFSPSSTCCLWKKIAIKGSQVGIPVFYLSICLLLEQISFGSRALQQLQGSPAVGDAYGFHAALLVRWILRQPLACWICDYPLVPGRGCLEEATFADFTGVRECGTIGSALGL